jgi:uncharacterized protein
MSCTVGTVVHLARYPVKSLGGERLDEAVVEERGLVGDRVWATYTEDGGIGSGKTTRRFRKVDGLLEVGARLEGVDDGVPVLDLGGAPVPADDPAAAAGLSALLGRRLELRRESDVPHHDDCPVHLVTTASLRRLQDLYGDRVDPERFRANLVIATDGVGFVEDDWSGHELALGEEVVLRLGRGMPRCVMVDMPQPADDLPEAPGLLKLLGQEHEIELGLQASVVQPGRVRLGDRAVLR